MHMNVHMLCSHLSDVFNEGERKKEKKYRPLLRVNENERKKEKITRKTKIQKIHTRSNAFLINGKFPDNHKKKS